jgi:hypothetical protein
VVNDTRSSGLEMLKGRQIEGTNNAAEESLGRTSQLCILFWVRDSSASLPPLQHLQPGGPGVIQRTHNSCAL